MNIWLVTIGNLDILKLLVSMGFDVNVKYEKRTLLHYLIGEGDYELVEFIIHNGADVNIRGALDRTALEYARVVERKGENYKKIVELLLENGAK